MNTFHRACVIEPLGRSDAAQKRERESQSAEVGCRYLGVRVTIAVPQESDDLVSLGFWV